MEVNIQHLGGVKFEAQARGLRVICDQPFDNGGGDEGMTPPEFLLVSLGTCIGYYAVEYLRTRSLPTEGLCVNVTAEKAMKPARFCSICVRLSVPELDTRHMIGIERAVKACVIHNTLTHQPVIETVVHCAGESSAT
jgi:putative redox protein